MSRNLRPPGAAAEPDSDRSHTQNIQDIQNNLSIQNIQIAEDGDGNSLRLLSRSPHPYQHQASDKFAIRPTAFPPEVSREHTPSSCSGTEADDEHVLKGLPAPRLRLHKGLRGKNEVVSGTSTPIPPTVLDEEERGLVGDSKKTPPNANFRLGIDGPRRRKEIVRRLFELVIVASLGLMVQTNGFVKPILRRWNRELYVWFGVTIILLLLYPLRLIVWASQHRKPSKSIPILIPAAFDPAPILYPPAITLFVSSLIAVDNAAVLLPNIILAISSLPPALLPSTSSDPGVNPLHWALSCLPLFFSGHASAPTDPFSRAATVSADAAALLYPLHVNLYTTLHTLTTTSLLPAELQLLSVALINVLLLSSSPQAIILKAALWVGGLDLLVSCSRVILWGIALARVPKWRFKRIQSSSKSRPTFLSYLIPWRRVRHEIFHVPPDSSPYSSLDEFDDHEDSDDPAKFRAFKGGLRVSTINFNAADSAGGQNEAPLAIDNKRIRFNPLDTNAGSPPRRRHTLPGGADSSQRSLTHTPSGRRKRSASSSVRAFFSLTQGQATFRKWQYAAWVYACIGAALFAPVPIVGILEVVKTEALRGNDAVGWALGYMFGGLPAFRFQVVSHNLERWICLPERSTSESSTSQTNLNPLGWVAELRHSYFGEANTRLLMCAYCLGVIGVGLVVVFRLSPFYEVDTRRKVFHFMMVAMFLPLTYVDPAFVSLALAVVLALFLLLDLLRASQLPPLSRPLASFLAPYVDGRDLRGPVVVSHIFLLIGCAIPLWLSLGSLPRSPTTTTTTAAAFAGWELPAREVAMVSGVVCVGLGDAAASLIGRRWGHRKWLWGGGKSLEGSLAFACAVFLGLVAAHAWLRIGGWFSPPPPSPVSASAIPTSTVDAPMFAATGHHHQPWPATLSKTAVCATMASLTEAVLTGGNDNVIVPVVLWTCVKGLGV